MTRRALVGVVLDNFAVAIPLLVLACSGLLAAAAQQPVQPTFRANVNAVQVDVRVVDADGRFVSDLTADEFRVSEEGGSQKVTTFGLVDIPIALDPGPTVAGGRVEADIATNARSAEGRIYVIVMDDKPNHLSVGGRSLSTADSFVNPGRLGIEQSSQIDRGSAFNGQSYLLRAQAYRDLAREFVENHLGEADRAAIVSTSGRKEMAQEFTSNHQRLLATINRFEMGFGAEPVRIESEIQSNPGARTPTGEAIDTSRGKDVIDSSHSAMIGLSSLAKWVGQIQGRRKSIVMFTERMGDSFNLSRQGDEAEDLRRFVQETARANVGLYIIDPIGNPHGAGARGNSVDDSGDVPGSFFGSEFDALRRDGLMSLAEATGGFAVTGSNEFTQGFERIVEENSSYYMLGYNSTNAKQDGKFRRIKVEVTRPGLTVRTRAGYFGRDSKPPKPANAPAGVSASLAEIMSSPLPVPGLTMTVSAPVFRGEKDTASVGVIVEARGQDLQFLDEQARFRGAMEIVVAAFDPDGTSKAAEKGTVKMDLSRETRDAITQNSVRLVAKLPLKPGRYQLRVTGADAGTVGQMRGSVMYDLDVPDFSREPLSMSGIALASAALSLVPTNGTDKRWSAAFRSMPTSHREFVATDELRNYVEVYDSDPKSKHQIEVRTTIRDEGGIRIFSNLKTMTPQFAGKNMNTVTLPYTTSIPLRTFPGGAYVLTIEARNTSNDGVVVKRQVPFRIR